MEYFFIKFGFNIVFYIFLSLFSTFLLKKFIWFLNPIFYFINFIIWFFYNPIRGFLKNRSGEGGRRTFVLFRISLISPIYFIVIHILLTPLRVLTAIYYDVLVYLSIMLNDLLNDLFKPKIGKYRRESGMKYLFHYIIAFPYRLIVFLIRSSLIIIDSIFMFCVSVVFPTLTMYHGTSFNEAGTNIIQSAEWKVGSGDFAGLGVYFAVEKKVAIHYAKSSSSSNDVGMLIVRITTSFTRNASTLEKYTRGLIGNNGRRLSNKLPFPYSTIEHWRDDLSGWEYCLVQPNKLGKYIKSWRIRPVALIEIGSNREESVPRIWGGISHYSLLFSGVIAGVFSFFVLAILIANLNF